MPDDLDTQLRAFGDTLAHHSGEPIRPALRLDARRSVPVRTWGWLGAAACVMALVAGLVIAGGRNDPPAPATQPGTTSSATGTTAAPPSVDPPTVDEWLASVPADPLRLDGDGWSVQDRQGELLDLALFAQLGCATTDQAAEAADLPSVHEWFQSDANGGLDLDVSVVSLRAGDASRLTEIFAGLTGCGEFAGGSVVEDPSAGATGVLIADAFALVVVTPVGDAAGDRAVLLELESEGVVGALDDVIARAAAYLAGDAPAPDHESGIESRPVTEAELERIRDAGRLDCGPYEDTLSYPMNSQPAPAETAPFTGDARAWFVDWRSGVAESLGAARLRALPLDGWIELVESDTRSTFVLVDGDRWLASVAVERIDGWVSSFGFGLCDSVVMPEPTFTVGESVPVGAQPPVDEPGSLVLWVSNQSFVDDPVGITVEIDGRQVVSDRFEVGSQHNWIRFDLAGIEPGQHFLLATSDTGAVLTEAVATVGDAVTYAVVDYSRVASTDPTFMFTVSDEPIGFA